MPVEPDPPVEALEPAVEEVELASGVEDSGMEDATPGAFAMLTQGSGGKKKEPEKTATASGTDDPGLGPAGGRTLSGSEVQAGIRPNLPQVRACYEKELKRVEGFSGKVVVAWTIGADGVVRRPKVIQDSTRNRAMLPCITRVVSRWRFAKAESPTDVEYPFRFKPSDGF